MDHPPIRLSPSKKWTPKPSRTKVVTTQSLDRAYTGVTRLIPESPTKSLYSNDKKVGGDGSLNRIRSKFTNGLISPENLAHRKRLQLSPMAASTENHHDNGINTKRNLLDSLSNDSSVAMAKPTSMKPAVNKISKPKVKKTVSFDIPYDTTDSDLSEIKELLRQVLENQKQLTQRLDKIERNMDR